MNRLTILLIIIAIIVSGVGGFILGAQNSQLIPTVTVTNNTTNDSGHSTNYNTSKSTKTTTKSKTNTTTNTTVKKNTTPVVNNTNSSS